eukprot:5586307-Pleurochrysis_carterae.AAC.1
MRVGCAATQTQSSQPARGLAVRALRSVFAQLQGAAASNGAPMPQARPRAELPVSPGGCEPRAALALCSSTRGKSRTNHG